MQSKVPEYVKLAVPVPKSGRVAWYKNTFPTYAGIFLWVGFYLDLAAPTLGFASVSVCLWGLLLAGFLCFALYYYAPAMLGMQTGHSLYVVGTSTFGTSGGYLMPGLLMGFLQIGWIAVQASVAATFIMNGLGHTSKGLFAVIAIAWIFGLGWVGIKGIHHVGRAANYVSWFPLIMLLIVFWYNKDGISHYVVPHKDSLSGFLSVFTIVIGYFATAGAAGADFGMTNRNRKDIVLGGVFGIVCGTVVAGGLAILSVAGYIGRAAGPVSYSFSAAISSVGPLAPIMFYLFATATLVPTCFSSFIASNSFNSMLPKVPRTISALAALSVAALLAITGVAGDLVGFFGIVGASFGPICGAMAADYLIAGRRWAGPRQGINWAGYLAWASGFFVGILNQIPGIPAAWVKADNPSVLFSLVVGFVVYIVLARAGLLPAVLSGEPQATASAG
jgi:purine-cytosine permease-like protein